MGLGRFRGHFQDGVANVIHLIQPASTEELFGLCQRLRQVRRSPICCLEGRRRRGARAVDIPQVIVT